MKPRLLDLFCGAGGAAVGYHRAGFEVVGVDIRPQPNYPFSFVQADALDFLRQGGDGFEIVQPTNDHVRDLLGGAIVAIREFDVDVDEDRAGHGVPFVDVLDSPKPAPVVKTFDAIHASPPCQAYSVTASLHDTEYPDLVGQVRELLIATGLPYVIENVQGAPLVNHIRLCGSSFGLGVRRHRLFEINPMPMFPPPCAHYLQPEPIDVTGTGGPASREPGQGGGIHRKPKSLAHAREAMDIDWMSRRELSEAVPPAYTEWVGLQLMQHLQAVAA